jgi:putative CocE/NonD family hydrolase
MQGKTDMNSQTQPKPRRGKIWRILGWILLGLVALIAAVVALLSWSPAARDWTAKRLLTDPIIHKKLAATPVRTDAQPVRLTKVAMRDGKLLSTQIFLPKGKGPWPVIVVRDPYSFAHYGTCDVWVRYDYACVYQEVRGRGPSQGTWYPFVDERRDGLDLIHWILRQPWQNGKLAMTGGSYLGVVQWALSADLPPEVKTFIPTVAHGDVYQLAYRNGAFDEGIAGMWLSSQFRSPLSMLTATKDWSQNVAGHFPAIGVPRSGFGQAWPAYQDYLLHPDFDDPYWQSPDYVALREAHRKVQVPVFMIGYANDFFQPGMLRTYEELPTRDQSLMMIGPGNHGGNPEAEIEGSYTNDQADTLAWLDHYLRGQPLPDRLRPGVNVFEHGANRWRHYARWPLAAPGAKPLTYHLAQLPRSQDCDGGTLSAAPPAGETPVGYVYDPRNPTPTRGGPYKLISDTVVDQRDDLCARPDVLSFASPPLAAETLLSGAIKARLRVASNAADTTFTVKLSEHFADGRVYNIRDDISTLAMRNGAKHRQRYTPGEPVEVVFDMTPILWRLHKGSRLRLDISSSNAPAFFPHPNSAELWSRVANPVVAHQTLYGGSIEIPVE